MNVPTTLALANDHCQTEYNVSATQCAWFTVTGSNGVTYNATASIGSDQKSVILVATNVPDGVTAVASSFGWAQWPINTIKSAEGFPLQPWNMSVGA
jgi:hypothetical protein